VAAPAEHPYLAAGIPQPRDDEAPERARAFAREGARVFLAGRTLAKVIARSEYWTHIHPAIVPGILLMLAGLIAIRHSFDGGLPEALTRLGAYAAAVGVTIGLITVILDGVAAKQLADRWAMDPEAEKSIALSVVSANETINFALAGLFNMSFAGVPFILLGLAVALSRAFPRWLGWTAVAAGSGSIGAGLVQAFTGEPTMASLILTIIGPTVISLWLLVMGILLLRKAARPARPDSTR
jgi:hypothetical protein